MLKKIMEKYYQFGFKKILDEYKNYSKDEKDYILFVVSNKRAINTEPITNNRTLLNFRFFRILKSFILPLLTLNLPSYFFNEKIYFFSNVLCLVLIILLSIKQDIYLQRRFKNIDDELEKKHRACNLYLKEK
ncbi:hypothetical protein L5F23_01635 [Aliarcobacter butzleri]|uniref:hypothetical protein n=1 Tax=Aliarcobacter butzleri TaxID=28197 RepID=UPI001EDBFB83|nr:hypothetical protein [Aliarcobacter butzleri]MCG3655402.1 hypothetical protein [Aliarcobacter butzleri]